MSLRCTRAISVLLVLKAVTVHAQRDPSRVVDEGLPRDARLEKAVTLDGFHPWAPAGDLESLKQRSKRTRRQILVAAGLWPMPEKTPLEPVIHGKIDREDYTVEKVFFQSHPGFYVTGNLYRPKARQGQRPGVLSPHGHWPNGRFYDYQLHKGDAQKLIDAGGETDSSGASYPLQARCAHLARMGCVVFHYDMVGYADSTQLGHHRSGFGDLDAELRLQSSFGLQTWNSIRAFEFLSSLPDVDPKRIGVTGASGGGTQTFILCAIDPRPAVCFPAVMVSVDMQGGCVCENASHLRVGTTNVEFAALAAPRPYAMTGADDWTREIMSKGLPELKATWKRFGKEDLVEAWCHTEFKHNYNQVSREYMYAWFKRHLGLHGPVKEQPFDPVPPAELSVFNDEHPLPADAVDLKKLRAYLAESSDRQMATLVPKDAKTLEEFRRIVGGALETMLHTTLPASNQVEAKDHGQTALGGRSYRRLLLGRRGSGESVPALLFKPARWNGTVVVAVGDRGKGTACFTSSFLPPYDRIQGDVEQLLASGAAVLAPDVFLTGEYFDHGPDLPVFQKDEERHSRFVGYTYGYNRTLLAERVHDILTTVAYARSLPGAKQVNLLGMKAASTWVALALALAGDAVSKTVISEIDPFAFSKLKSLEAPNFLPGALKYGDMPAFLALCAPAKLRLVSRHDPDQLVRAAYRAAGAPRAFEPITPSQSVPAVLEWIAR